MNVALAGRDRSSRPKSTGKLEMFNRLWSVVWMAVAIANGTAGQSHKYGETDILLVGLGTYVCVTPL